MSRFDNLELGDESNSHSRHRDAPLLKDEAHYLAEATRAFESAEFEPALRFYSKVLEFNPRNVAAWTGQVRMLIELEEFQEAGLWADKALERFPDEPELLAAKAVALGRSGDTAAAMMFSDASIRERGDTPYVWLARGDVLLSHHESRSDYCFEKALLLAPGDWFIRWLAGRIRFVHEQFALALKLFQEAVELNAGHFVTWLELGRCQHALGLAGPARTSLAQAKQLNPLCRDANLEWIRAGDVGFAARLRGWWRRQKK
jgi:tetratricopeptide (TPR) repeat protein